MATADPRPMRRCLYLQSRVAGGLPHGSQVLFVRLPWPALERSQSARLARGGSGCACTGTCGGSSFLTSDHRAGYWRGPEGCPPECPGIKPPNTWSEAVPEGRGGGAPRTEGGSRQRPHGSQGGARWPSSSASEVVVDGQEGHVRPDRERRRDEGREARRLGQVRLVLGWGWCRCARLNRVVAVTVAAISASLGCFIRGASFDEGLPADEPPAEGPAGDSESSAGRQSIFGRAYRGTQ